MELKHETLRSSVEGARRPGDVCLAPTVAERRPNPPLATTHLIFSGGFYFTIYYFYIIVYNINRNKCIVAGTAYRHNKKVQIQIFLAPQQAAYKWLGFLCSPYNLCGAFYLLCSSLY